MRHIGYLPDEPLARRFADYLLTQGMDLMVEADPRGWALWIAHDDHVERAGKELAAFRTNSDQPKYAAAQLQGTKVRAEEDKRQRRLREKHIDVRTSWALGRQRAQPLTVILVALSVLATLAMWQLAAPGEYSPVERWLFISFIRPEFAILPEIRHGQLWRLVTPIFLHFSAMHLIFNLFWLWDLGGVIENRKGTLKLGLMVLAAAVVPNLLQYWWGGPGFGGMSGVVYALFGYVWMKGRYDPEDQLGLAPQTVFIMLAWLFVAPLILGNIANAAHAGGLAVGVLAGAGPYFTRKWLRKTR